MGWLSFPVGILQASFRLKPRQTMAPNGVLQLRSREPGVPPDAGDGSAISRTALGYAQKNYEVTGTSKIRLCL